MPQLILKERTPHLTTPPATIFLQEIMINIKTRHFHSSINHQEHFFHITHIPSYFCPVTNSKFLRTGFL